MNIFRYACFCVRQGRRLHLHTVCRRFAYRLPRQRWTSVSQSVCKWCGLCQNGARWGYCCIDTVFPKSWAIAFFSHSLANYWQVLIRFSTTVVRKFPTIHVGTNLTWKTWRHDVVTSFFVFIVNKIGNTSWLWNSFYITLVVYRVGRYFTISKLSANLDSIRYWFNFIILCTSETTAMSALAGVSCFLSSTGIVARRSCVLWCRILLMTSTALLIATFNRLFFGIYKTSSIRSRGGWVQSQV